MLLFFNLKHIYYEKENIQTIIEAPAKFHKLRERIEQNIKKLPKEDQERIKNYNFERDKKFNMSDSSEGNNPAQKCHQSNLN